jgi:hypothetical protein
MENDTLWLDRPRGKELFCPRRIDFYSRLNLSVFACPFNPPLDGFPDTLGYLAPVAGPGTTPPQPEFFVPDNSVPATGNWVGIQAELISIAAGKQYGIARNSYSVLSEDAGMPVIQYMLGDYDRRWWFPSNYLQRPFPPRVDEYVFTCVQNH